MVVPRFYPLRVRFLQQYCPRVVYCFVLHFANKDPSFKGFLYVLKNYDDIFHKSFFPEKNFARSTEGYA